MLVRGLPVDSRLMTVLPRTGDSEVAGASRWSHTEYLLADLYDLLYAVHARGASSQKYPRPTPLVPHRRADPERVAELRRRTGREAV